MYTDMWYIFLEKSVKCTRKKDVQIYENKTRKKESVVTRFQIKLEEIQICELLGLISHTNMSLEHQQCLFSSIPNQLHAFKSHPLTCTDSTGIIKFNTEKRRSYQQ